MSAPLILAAGGPVIPHFGGASKCIVQNHQFCASWFFDNFSSRFEPRLWEHLQLTAIAVGIGGVIAFSAAILACSNSAVRSAIAHISSKPFRQSFTRIMSSKPTHPACSSHRQALGKHI